SPWFLKDGLVNVFHPPFLHWSFAVGPAGAGTCSTPLTVMFEMSAVPWMSIRMSMAVIVPVGNATWPPPAAIVAAVNVYVAVPSALIVGVTLLQPRKNSPSDVLTSKRGEP